MVSVNRLARNDPASIGEVLPGIEVRFGENSVLQVKGPNVMLATGTTPRRRRRCWTRTAGSDTGDEAGIRTAGCTSPAA